MTLLYACIHVMSFTSSGLVLPKRRFDKLRPKRLSSNLQATLEGLNTVLTPQEPSVKPFLVADLFVGAARLLKGTFFAAPKAYVSRAGRKQQNHND